jgi:hypothetical protein
MAMEFHARAAELRHRLYRHDIVALAGEPGRIASGAGADVEDPAWPGRQKRHHRRKDIFRPEGLEPGDQILRVAGIAGKDVRFVRRDLPPVGPDNAAAGARFPPVAVI